MKKRPSPTPASLSPLSLLPRASSHHPRSFSTLLVLLSLPACLPAFTSLASFSLPPTLSSLSLSWYPFCSLSLPSFSPFASSTLLPTSHPCPPFLCRSSLPLLSLSLLVAFFLPCHFCFLPVPYHFLVSPLPSYQLCVPSAISLLSVFFKLSLSPTCLSLSRVFLATLLSFCPSLSTCPYAIPSFFCRFPLKSRMRNNSWKEEELKKKRVCI